MKFSYFLKEHVMMNSYVLI